MTITNDWGKMYCVSYWGVNSNKQTIQEVINSVCS